MKERLEQLVARANPDADWGSSARNDAILLSLFQRCVELEKALNEIVENGGVGAGALREIARAALLADSP